MSMNSCWEKDLVKAYREKFVCVLELLTNLQNLSTIVEAFYTVDTSGAQMNSDLFILL